MATSPLHLTMEWRDAPCQLMMRERSGWRELASNHRSRGRPRRSRGIGSRLRRLSVGGESSGADMGPSRNLIHAVLTVRIRLPPAESLVQTLPHTASGLRHSLDFTLRLGLI